MRIRWDENVDNKHCVDFYVLKYWQEGENPNHKKHTDTQIKPTLEGNKLYNFQVIAFQVRNSKLVLKMNSLLHYAGKDTKNRLNHFEPG